MPFWHCVNACWKEDVQKDTEVERQHVVSASSWVPALQDAQRVILGLDGNWLLRLRSAAAAIGSSLGFTVVRVYAAHPSNNTYVWLAEVKRHPAEPQPPDSSASQPTRPRAAGARAAPGTSSLSPHAPRGTAHATSPGIQGLEQRGPFTSAGPPAAAVANGGGGGYGGTPLSLELESPPLPLLVLDDRQIYALACGDEVDAELEALLRGGGGGGGEVGDNGGVGPPERAGGRPLSVVGVPTGTGTKAATEGWQDPTLIHKDAEAAAVLGAGPGLLGRYVGRSGRQQQKPQDPVNAAHSSFEDGAGKRCAQSGVADGGPGPGSGGGGEAARGCSPKSPRAGGSHGARGGGSIVFALVIRAGSARVGALVVEGGPGLQPLAAATAAANATSMLNLSLISADASAAGANGSHALAACPSGIAFGGGATAAAADPAAVAAIQQLAATVGQVCWGPNTEVIAQAANAVASLRNAQLLSQLAASVSAAVETSVLEGCKMQPACIVALVHGSGLAAALLENCSRAMAMGASHQQLQQQGSAWRSAGLTYGGVGGSVGATGMFMLGASRSASAHLSRHTLADTVGLGLDYSYERLAYDGTQVVPVVAHVLTTQQTLLDRALTRPADADAAASAGSGSAGARHSVAATVGSTFRRASLPVPVTAAAGSGLTHRAVSMSSAGSGARRCHLRAALRAAAAAAAGPPKATPPSTVSSGGTSTRGPTAAKEAAAAVVAAAAATPANGCHSPSHPHPQCQSHIRSQGPAVDHSQQSWQRPRDGQGGVLRAAATAAAAAPGVVSTAAAVVPDVWEHVQDPTHGSKDLLLLQSRAAGNRTTSVAILTCTFRRRPRPVAEVADSGAAGGSGAGAGVNGLTLAVYMHFPNGPLPMSFLQHAVHVAEPVVQLLTPVLLRRLADSPGPIPDEWACLHDCILAGVIAREGLGPTPLTRTPSRRMAAQHRESTSSSAATAGLVPLPGPTATTPAVSSTAAGGAGLAATVAARPVQGVTAAPAMMRGEVGSPGREEVAGSPGSAALRRCPGEPMVPWAASCNERLLAGLNARSLAPPPAPHPGTSPALGSAAVGGLPSAGCGGGSGVAWALSLGLGGATAGASMAAATGQLSVAVNYIRGNLLRPLLTSVHGALTSVMGSIQNNNSGLDAALVAAAAHQSDVLTAGAGTPLAELAVKVGQGTFGCVYIGTWQGVTVAIKVIPAVGVGQGRNPPGTSRTHGPVAAGMAALGYPAAATTSGPTGSPSECAPSCNTMTIMTTTTNVRDGVLMSSTAAATVQSSAVQSLLHRPGGAPASTGTATPRCLASLPSHAPPQAPGLLPVPSAAAAPPAAADNETVLLAARAQSVRDAFELAALRVVSHPNIVQVFATYPDALLQPLDESGGAELPAVLLPHPQDMATPSTALKRWVGGGGGRGSRPQRLLQGLHMDEAAGLTATTAAAAAEGSLLLTVAGVVPGEGDPTVTVSPAQIFPQGPTEVDESLLCSTLLSANHSQVGQGSANGSAVTAIVMEHCDAGSLADLLRQGGIRRMMLAREYAAALAAMSSAAAAIATSTPPPPPSPPAVNRPAAAPGALLPQSLETAGVAATAGTGGTGGTDCAAAGHNSTAVVSATSMTAAAVAAADRLTAIHPSTITTSATCTTSWGSACVYDMMTRPSPTTSGRLPGQGQVSDGAGVSAGAGGAVSSIPSKAAARSASALSTTDQRPVPSASEILATSPQRVLSQAQQQQQLLPSSSSPGRGAAGRPSGAQMPQAGQAHAGSVSPANPNPQPQPQPQPTVPPQGENGPIPVQVEVTARPYARRASISLTASQTLVVLPLGGTDPVSPLTSMAAPPAKVGGAETKGENGSPPDVTAAASGAVCTGAGAGAGADADTRANGIQVRNCIAEDEQQEQEQETRKEPSLVAAPAHASTSADLGSVHTLLRHSGAQPIGSQGSQGQLLLHHPHPHHQPSQHANPTALPGWQRRPAMGLPPNAALLPNPAGYRSYLFSYPNHSLGMAGAANGGAAAALGLLSPGYLGGGVGGAGSLGAMGGLVPPMAPVPATPRTFEALRQFLATAAPSGSGGSGGGGGRLGGGLGESERLDFRPVMLIVLELASALRHLHSLRLVHCDVKPSNVLLRSSATDPRGWICKLSDFGCVRLLRYDDTAPHMPELGPHPAGALLGHISSPWPINSGDQESTARMAAAALGPSMNAVGFGGALAFDASQFVGSVQYMAPELLRREKRCTAAVDIYSLGVLMWELVSDGAQPYTGLTRRLPASLVEGICAGLRPGFGDNVPEWYRRLVESCWSGNPLERPSAAELVTTAKRWLEGGAAPGASTSTGGLQPPLQLAAT